MTLEEVKYSLDIAGETPDMVSPLLGVSYITFVNRDNKFIDVNSLRFKFDTTNEIVEIYFVEKVNLNTIPSNWVLYKDYDIIGENIYKYIKDQDGNLITDYYDMEYLSYFTFRG